MMATADQLFSEIFLDRSTPVQPFDGLFAATIAGNADTGQADVTIDGFDKSATYTCVFEPRVVGDSARTPPVGTKCLVAFTTPIAYATDTTGVAVPNVGVGAASWIVAFSVPAFAWPT
jgi:hypothetical protein